MSSSDATSTTPATVMATSTVLSTAFRNRFVADAADPIRFEWFMWAHRGVGVVDDVGIVGVLDIVDTTTWTKPMIAQVTRRGGTSLPFEN